MSLEQVFYIAQIAGSAAVVISIFYVGLQLRQNTVQLRRSAGDAAQTQASAVRLAIINSREVAELWTRGLAEAESMDAPDTLRLETLFTERAWLAYHMWHRSRSGLSMKGTWERAGLGYLALFLSTPGGSAWWARYKVMFPPQYAADVDKAMAKPMGG